MIASIKLLIEDRANDCFIIIASYWKMGIKYSLGKLDVKSKIVEIFELIEESGFTLLPILPAHILKNVALGFQHRNPFDRILIAQAIEENLTVVSKDENLKLYDINLIWKNEVE